MNEPSVATSRNTATFHNPPAAPCSNLAEIHLGDALPTSTTVEVSRLFRPGALLEVDITAVVTAR